MVTKVNGLEQLIEQTKRDIVNLEVEIEDLDSRGVVTPDDEIDPRMKLSGARIVLNSYEAVVALNG